MDNRISINSIQPSLNSSEIPAPDVEEVARREWERLNNELVSIRAQIEELQAKEGSLDAQVAAWGVILSAGGQLEVGERENKQHEKNDGDRILNKQESADAVVELLREAGEPLHYREIYGLLAAQGVEIKGKNPPNTLLARFFDDHRLERVAQGTYQVKVIAEVQPND